MRFLKTGLFAFFILTLVFSACRKDIVVDSSAKLIFSTDTIMFDTVFTKIGSTTKFFTVRNQSDKGIISIDKIFLQGGENSNFRLNVNGNESALIGDVELFPGDSIYVFVEVTVDPNNSNSPVIIEDKVIFDHNEKIQDVDLVAFGQNYHKLDGEFDTLHVWHSDKPYLIYNSMGVDSGETLVIEKGCQIYFHHGSSLFVWGTLHVKGSLEEPVIFQGDRLENSFEDVPGQWGHIRFLVGSHSNEIDYAVIKNATIGIQVDSFPDIGPSLKLSNTRIENISAVGLYTLGAKIQASNCVISNCGQSAAQLVIGGTYQFYHCTFGNYYAYGNRVTPTVLLNNWYEDVHGNINVRAIDNAYFSNCIIYGDKEGELGFDMYPGTLGSFQYTFENCLMRIDPDMEYVENRFLNCILNEDPFFMDPLENEYQLDTLSVAKDVADPTTAQFYPADLEGNSRFEDVGPDIGAYERVE
jgi:hypothetical protein